MVIAKHLINLVKMDSTEIHTNKHTALQILRPLLNVLSKDHANDVADSADVFIDLFSSSEIHQQISASALLCIGDLLLTLNVHMIKFLPRLMPPLINILSDEVHGYVFWIVCHHSIQIIHINLQFINLRL